MRARLSPAGLTRRLHQKGLLIHPYTFRNERQYLAWDYGADAHRVRPRLPCLALRRSC